MTPLFRLHHHERWPCKPMHMQNQILRIKNYSIKMIHAIHPLSDFSQIPTLMPRTKYPPLFPRQTPIRSAHRCLAIKPPHHASVTCNPQKHPNAPKPLPKHFATNFAMAIPLSSIPQYAPKNSFRQITAPTRTNPHELKPSTAPQASLHF